MPTLFSAQLGGQPWQEEGEPTLSPLWTPRSSPELLGRGSVLFTQQPSPPILGALLLSCQLSPPTPFVLFFSLNRKVESPYTTSNLPLSELLPIPGGALRLGMGPRVGAGVMQSVCWEG